MSYRDPKVIDDKSGLIIPNAIAAGVANIAKQWGAELGRQRDLNLKNRKEDLANDNRVEDEMAAMKSSLKNVPGGQDLVDTAQDVQYAAIDDLGKVRQELNNRDLSKKRKQELREEELAIVNGLNGMNASFPKITIEKDKAIKLKTNSAATAGKVAATTPENLAFSYGFHEGTSTYSYVPGSRKNGKYTPPSFKINSGGQTSDLAQFNSEDFSTTFEVTQLQPEAAALITKSLKDKKNNFLQGKLEGTPTMQADVPIFNEKGVKTGTTNNITTKATPETNNFMNQQADYVIAGIQEAGTPANRNSILKHQYAMSDSDIIDYTNNGPSLKLRFSIAQNNASVAGLEILNPNAPMNEPFAYAKIERSKPATLPKNKDGTSATERAHSQNYTLAQANFDKPVSYPAAAVNVAQKRMTKIIDGAGLSVGASVRFGEMRQLTAVTPDYTNNTLKIAWGTPYYGSGGSQALKQARDLVVAGQGDTMIKLPPSGVEYPASSLVKDRNSVVLDMNKRTVVENLLVNSLQISKTQANNLATNKIY